jgi:hypothetical protein
VESSPGGVCGRAVKVQITAAAHTDRSSRGSYGMLRWARAWRRKRGRRTVLHGQRIIRAANGHRVNSTRLRHAKARQHLHPTHHTAGMSCIGWFTLPRPRRRQRRRLHGQHQLEREAQSDTHGAGAPGSSGSPTLSRSALSSTRRWRRWPWCHLMHMRTRGSVTTHQS